ncbi:MAG: ATPase domain [Cyanobacteriota bacterium]|jgi:predicted ATPase
MRGMRTMIREVEIRGFKSLSQVDFELGRVNCIIGANGTGKGCFNSN